MTFSAKYGKVDNSVIAKMSRKKNCERFAKSTKKSSNTADQVKALYSLNLHCIQYMQRLSGCPKGTFITCIQPNGGKTYNRLTSFSYTPPPPSYRYELNVV